MLVIQIALGIVLGYLLIRYLDQVIALLGVFLAIVLFIGFIVLCVGLGAWLFSNNQAELIAIALMLCIFITLGIGASFLSKYSLLTNYESFGTISALAMLSFASYAMWEKYQKYGDISAEATRIAPFLFILIVLAGVLASRVYKRSDKYRQHEQATHDLRRKKKSEKLDQLKNDWERLNISNEFVKVHHFCSDKFKSRASSLEEFYQWCKPRDFADENEQTVDRGLFVVSQISEGSSVQEAIEKSWQKYPLVKR